MENVTWWVDQSSTYLTGADVLSASCPSAGRAKAASARNATLTGDHLDQEDFALDMMAFSESNT